MSMLQGRLGALIGQSSGYIESLPEPVQKRIRALKNLQKEQMKMECKFREEVLALEKKYLQMYAPLYDKRAQIACGDYEPTEEETKFGDAETEESEKEKKTEGSAPTASEGEAQDVKGIPEFWLTIFKNSPMLEAELGENDEEIMAHLKDIKVSYLDDNPGFKLDFVFGPNEFFTNEVLSKTYYLADDEDNEYGDVVFDYAEGTEITWKEGKDATVKVELKKQRNKQNNRTRVVKKTIKIPSFFHFFNPPQADEEEEDEDEEIGEQIQHDYEVGEHLKDVIIPRAVGWFTGEAAAEFGPDFDDEDGEDYDDYDEKEDDEEDDEEEKIREIDGDESDEPASGSRPREQRRPPKMNQEKPTECKQQ